MIRIILMALLALTFSACSSVKKSATGETSSKVVYNVKPEAEVEKGRVLNEIPQWYIDAQVDKGLIKNRDADNFIYAVGSGTSPDLQLAVDKAIMVAKASLADQLEGEMNKRADLYITEVGKEGNKKVASKVESTIVNIIENTKVQGYEEWNKAVYETPSGNYRVYIGLKMGVGDANKLAEYIVAHADVSVDVDALAADAIENVMPSVPTDKVTVLD